MTLSKPRICSVAIAAIAATALAGCSDFREVIQRVSVQPAVVSKEGPVDQNDKPMPVDLDTFGAYVDGAGNHIAATYKRPADKVTQVERNQLQEAIISASDATCSEFRRELFALHSVRKVGFQGAAILLSGAAAAVGGAAAKTALAAASTAVLGVDQTIDANVLQNNAIDLILHTITSERQNALADMRKKQSATPADYTAQAAVTDAIHYNSLCSLTEAVSSLYSSVDKKVANAQALKEVQLQFAETQLHDVERRLMAANAAKSPNAANIKILSDERDRAQKALDALTAPAQ